MLSVKAKLSVTPLSSKISTSICRNNNNNKKVDGRKIIIIIIIIIKDNMLIANTGQQEK